MTAHDNMNAVSITINEEYRTRAYQYNHPLCKNYAYIQNMTYFNNSHLVKLKSTCRDCSSYHSDFPSAHCSPHKCTITEKKVSAPKV